MEAKKSIKNRIIIRFSLLAIVSISLIILSSIYFVSKIINEQANNTLVIKTNTIYNKIEERISYLIKDTQQLSKNKLMINSFVDEDGKKAYLEPLVQNFIEDKYVVSLNVVDFEGLMIYQTSTYKRFINSSHVKLALSLGESIFHIDSKTQELIIIVPIKYYDTTQGSLIAVYDFSKLVDRYVSDKSDEYAKIIKNNKVLYSNNFSKDRDYYSYKQNNTSDSIFHKIGISLEVGILSSSYLAPLNKALINLSLVGLIIIIIGISLAYILATSIAEPILKLYKIVKNDKSNESDYKTLDTNDELEVLSNAFFEKTKELETFNKSLEEKVEERTKELVKQIYIAKSANEAKSQFLANMSHEIRTPLNAIMGFIDILKENEDDKNKINSLEIIDTSSQNLLEIINDILDFSKIESSDFPIESIDFNIEKEIQMIYELFNSKAKEKDITLSLEFKTLPKSLKGDALRIKQVVHNLLSNAIKFTPKDKKIFFAVTYKNELLNISIKDEGIGISEEYQNNIFKAFTQEDSSTTRQYGGTGLGLTISYNLVKLMNGELKVKSKKGEGSNFYFAIPLKEGQEIKETKIILLNNDLKAHILVVEDNKANQLFMKILLKKLNITFDIAKDGLEAIEMFKKHSYDVILMDENMPHMNGIEATKIIITYEKENHLIHTPIVALTANALKDDRKRFLEAGMDEYLTKPLSKEKLISTLSILLPKS